MSMSVSRGVRHFIVHPNPSSQGGAWVECYRSDCHAPSTGQYRSHDGASSYACDEHTGDCHEGCWS